jgi:hypothetical protein
MTRLRHGRTGTVGLEPLPRNEKRSKQPRPYFLWAQTAAITAVNGFENSHHKDSKLSWHHGKYVIARSEDQCKVGAWVYSERPFMVWL